MKISVTKSFCALAVSILALSDIALAADEYKIDPNHSTIGFSVKHMMVSNVPGRFTDYAGIIRYDDKDVTKSSVEMTIKTASINTDNAQRDAHLRTGDFFEAEKYPEASFKSKRIEKRGEQLVAVGDLTIKDVTKEIELPFTIEGVIGEANGGKRMGVSAATTINRQDYNVKWQRPLQNAAGVTVSDTVKLQFELEARKSGAQTQIPGATK